MNKILIIVGTTTFISSGLVMNIPMAAATADCVILDEYQNVDMGMVKSHVQQDIFDGYTGFTFWTDETSDALFQYKDYNRCSADGYFQIKYRFDKADGGPWKVIEKNIYVP